MIDINLLSFKDIVLQNGKINPDIYNSLQNKKHYFKDITMINKLVNMNNHVENTIHVYKKSKQYYTSLKIQTSFPVYIVFLSYKSLLITHYSSADKIRANNTFNFILFISKMCG